MRRLSIIGYLILNFLFAKGQSESVLNNFPKDFYIEPNRTKFYSQGSSEVIRFRRDTLREDLILRHTTIEQSINLENVVITGNIIFDHVTFSDKITFTNSVFAGNVLFASVDLGEWSYFKNATFLKEAIFEGANFFMGTDFSGCLFNGETRFRNSNYYKEGYYNQSSFSRLTRFDGTNFLCETFFNNTILGDTLDFSQVKTNENIDFTTTILKPNASKCLLNISGTSTKTLKLNFANFKLLFNPNLNNEQKASIYAGLLDKLKSEGLMESVKYLDIDFTTNFKILNPKQTANF